MRTPSTSRLVVLAVVCALSTSTFAEERGRGEMREGPEAARMHEAPTHAAPMRAGPVHVDRLYNHNQSYPARGAVVTALPAGNVPISYHGARWFYQGGVWYRPVGARFVVGAPPLGIVVPLLPAAFVTLSIGGLAYYYANGIYYTAAPGGYTVVAPPPGAAAAVPVPAPQ